MRGRRCEPHLCNVFVLGYTSTTLVTLDRTWTENATAQVVFRRVQVHGREEHLLPLHVAAGLLLM